MWSDYGISLILLIVRFLYSRTCLCLEIMDILGMVTEMMETPCRIWLGPILTIILGKPEDFQTILLSSKCLDKPYMYRFMDDNIGLFTAPG